MQYTTAIVLAVAGLAAAQSTTSSAATSSASADSQSGCGTAIDAIITNCLASTGTRVSDCSDSDWKCLCDNQRAVLTCYDNCPSDPNRFGAEQTSVSWCNAAKAYSSSSSSSNATVSTSSSASSSTGSSTATATDAESTETGSSSTASRSSSASAASSSATDSAAGNIALPAGGMIAAVFGIAAAMI
ncbi:hypothetical protein MBLNU13_g01939t1 [Cladosporium sp. NU13]